MMQRFHALIDAITPYITASFRYISIGNEVDIYLANYQEWDAYRVFYDDAAAYIHKVLPDLKVGVTVTFSGATGDSADAVKKLNEASDVYIVTYYPLNAEFNVRPPDAPLKDFPGLVQQAGDHPLILQEVGYPAAEVLNSSEQAQADFVASVYKAWETVGNEIPFLDFFLLHDFTKPMCDQFTAYYGLPDVKNFYEYLCTLGFRKADGTPWLAWNAFVAGAKSAGLPRKEPSPPIHLARTPARRRYRRIFREGIRGPFKWLA